MRLTDLQIKRLKPPASGQKAVFDDAMPGFGLRVSQGGSKSFIVMYGPKRRLRTIGRYPDVSLAEARKNARRLLAGLQDTGKAVSQRERLTFVQARARFLADSKSRNKPRTYRDYSRLLTKHFNFQANIDQVSRANIMAAVEALSSTPSERQHAFVAIRVMMNWCERHGLIERSPVPRMATSSTARSHILSDADLVAVWQRAVDYGYPYGPIVQLLILTGQRRGEIAGLRRSWVEDGLVTFPVGFTKNKREHRMPLSDLARQVLDGVPNTGDLLFPARGSEERCFNGWGKSKASFDRTIDVEPYVLHDLRRTFSSNMARMGTPIFVTERLLNHVSGTVSGVAAVYNRYSYLDEMKEAADAHDEFLRSILDQNRSNQNLTSS